MKSKPAKKVIHADFPARCPQVACGRLYTYIGPPFCWRFSVHFDPRSSQQLPTKKGSMPGMAGTRSDQTKVAACFCFFCVVLWSPENTCFVKVSKSWILPTRALGGSFFPFKRLHTPKNGKQVRPWKQLGRMILSVYLGEMQIISFYN